MAKSVFQVFGASSTGRILFRKTLKRKYFLSFLANLHLSAVGMEARAASEHWGPELFKPGHDVKLTAPQHVKPYVKTKQNDAAEAFAEAATRPTMRFVSVKTVEKQELCMEH